MTIAEYNSCVDSFADGVYRFILKSLDDEELARDVVQESFTRLWERRKDVKSEKAKSYLFTTAYHTMIDTIRKEKRQTRLEDYHISEMIFESSAIDLKAVLNEAVDKLPEIQKSVVMLRDYEGYSYKEIGQITGLNESQVKVYIYRARVFLKNYIGSLHNVI
ncbi:MAG: sigma-70 family RNA polymerase sigma factor [Bacteroidales bacterium]|jgi:RNA polymerase sigma-70 factor (ECF subfamily)|nr:sigma-70 family RNA polymerase sigma factor [Bacteroidales bacterium]